jgi:hypothetical protein
MTTRSVPWPGNQINDINEVRERCYRQCHLENPTDSGWYEKTNACGQACKRALEVYEYNQGKNPCELKLQAPVFWFENGKGHETYESYEPMSGVSNTDGDESSVNIRTILLLLTTVLLAVYLIMFLVYDRP